MTRDWNNFFTAEDFSKLIQESVHTDDSDWGAEALADRANALLRAELERAPEVYGKEISIVTDESFVSRNIWSWCSERNCTERGDTHSARLVSITKLDDSREGE